MSEPSLPSPDAGVDVVAVCQKIQKTVPKHNKKRWTYYHVEAVLLIRYGALSTLTYELSQGQYYVVEALIKRHQVLLLNWSDWYNNEVMQRTGIDDSFSTVLSHSVCFYDNTKQKHVTMVCCCLIKLTNWKYFRKSLVTLCSLYAFFILYLLFWLFGIWSPVHTEAQNPLCAETLSSYWIPCCCCSLASETMSWIRILLFLLCWRNKEHDSC